MSLIIYLILIYPLLPPIGVVLVFLYAHVRERADGKSQKSLDLLHKKQYNIGRKKEEILMAKKKKQDNPFEKLLAKSVITIYDGVNGRTASTTFNGKRYSSTAPTDLPKRQQKPFAIKNLLNRIRVVYGVEPIE